MAAAAQREAHAPLAEAAASSTPAGGSLAICYALADQDFRRTKSLGIFNLSIGLLAALARQPQVGRLHVLGNREIAGFLPRGAPVTATDHDRPLRGRFGRIWWDQVELAQAARRSGCGWTYLPKGFVPWWVPLPGRVACYVHDTIQEFFRGRYPQAFSGLDRRYFAQSLRCTLRRAQVIFTNSEFTRQEVVRFARARRLEPPPTIVAGIGFDLDPVPANAKSGGIVCLASRWPHKRTDLAVRYLEQWQRETGYAGAIDWVGDVPERMAWPDCANWRRHRRLDHAAYQQLLKAGRALVFFTEYEGFGMPPVEAVLLGTCPVYSRLPVTTEVMAGVGHAFDNAEYTSFRQALERALATPPPVLGAWAERLRQRFSWTGVAERVVQGLIETSRASETGGGS